MPRLFVRALALFVLLSQVACATDTWTELFPGVMHLHRVTPTPWNIHVVKADLTHPRVRVRALIKNDNDYPDAGETVSSMANRHRAFVAINTDYFCGTQSACPNAWHCPQGWIMTDGLGFLPPGMSEPISTDRTCVQFTKDQIATIGKAATSQEGWWNVTAGGPRLVRDGQVSIEPDSGVPDVSTRQPRTGLAVSQDGRYLILAVVDGRQPGFSVGMTGTEMAQLLIEMGGYQGMNFDGGGSTTMTIGGFVVNSPSDGSERLVAAGLGIIDAIAQSPNPQCWFDTDFEDPPYSTGPVGNTDGWVVESGQPLIATIDSTQVLALSDDAVRRTFSSYPTIGVDWFDCRVRASAWPVDAQIEVGNAPGTSVAALIWFKPNYRIAYFEGDRAGGGTWKELTTYFPNQWYRISLRLDHAKQSYSLYLKDILRASGVAYRHASAANGLAFVRLIDSAPTANEFYVDDVYAGNVDPWYPRVFPNAPRVVAPGTKQFRFLNGTASTWEVIDEKLPGGATAPVGSVATIDANGRLTAVSSGTCKVRCTDAIGRMDTTSVITIVTGESPGTARYKAAGTDVDLAGLVVSGVFSGYFYAQAADRSSGIVVLSNTPVSVGQEVSVTGKMSTMGGELAVAGSWVEVTGAAGAPEPLMLTCRDIARQDPSGPIAHTGCSVAALLVRVAGKVASVEADRFLLDDGSQTPVPVMYSGLTQSDVLKKVVVTGLVAAYGDMPALRPRNSGDVMLQ